VRGVVVCPEPPAAEVGRRILSQGGNAVDAAIATAFTQGVANPLGCGIGGHAGIQVYSASHDVGLYLGASVSIGSALDPALFLAGLSGRSERVGRYLVKGDSNQLGYTSIMTPGFVAGMGELATRFGSGKVSWAQMVRPAADLAAEGFEVYPYLASYYTFEGPDQPGYPDVFRKLAIDKHAAALYLPEGQVPAVGFLLRQPELARTLREIADGGPEEFYGGGIGREVAEDLLNHGASVTAADLASYVVRSEMPIAMPWRELVFNSSPPPTRGAALLAMLRAVEDVDLATLGFNSPAYIDLLARVTNRVFANAAGVLADPVFSSVPVERLLSRDRAHDFLSSPLVATHGGKRQTDQERHTTHVTAADADGNTVAITQSIGSVTGAGVMTPSLGFFYNNFLGFFNPSRGYHDSMVPGKRVGGGCPTIAFKRGRPVLGIGSSGGSRLVSAVFQSILNMFVHGLTPQEAVSAPRFHCEQDGRLYLEPTFSPETVGALRDKGYEVIPTSYMGCNQAVLFDDGLLSGGSDPRGGIGIAIV
jgi:gamma-glutamyltranspeptidase/glutathione hydrolase